MLRFLHYFFVISSSIATLLTSAAAFQTCRSLIISGTFKTKASHYNNGGKNTQQAIRTISTTALFLEDRLAKMIDDEMRRLYEKRGSLGVNLNLPLPPSSQHNNTVTENETDV
jgi:hypothetical protein